MRIPANAIVADWIDSTQGTIFGETPPRYVRAALDQLEADRQIESQHWLNSTLSDIDRIIAAAAQLELTLPKMTRRALARDRFANFWRDAVAPHACSLKESILHERLNIARRGARIGLLPSGKMLIQWDDKAGLPLYDPDDAREEAMRLSRRVVPRLMELLERPGHRAYYLCGTAPNSPRGELAKGQRALYRRWLSLIRACKRKDRPFPIVGAVAVMESPLGRFGDWHPHLNIIVVCDGWLDFKALKQRWHWNMEMRPLDGHQSSIERAFREIIKYSCRTVSEKSLAKSQSDDSEQHTDRVRRALSPGAETGNHRRGHRAAVDALSAREVAGLRSGATPIVEPASREAPNSQTGQAPAMEEWRPVEVLEYHRAHARFRRSRTYRALYGIPKPPPPDLTGLQYRGRLKWDGREFRASFPLLESIPGDKSTTRDARTIALEAFQRLFGAPGQADRARQVLRSVDSNYKLVAAALEN